MSRVVKLRRALKRTRTSGVKKVKVHAPLMTNVQMVSSAGKDVLIIAA